MSVPVNRQAVAWAANTTLTISGVTYAAVGTVDAKWGYKIHEEVVTGTNNPYLGTGVFHGDCSFETLGSSDSRWETAISVSSGVAPTFGMTWRETDTQGLTLSGARTWTMSGKFTEYTKKVSKDGAVMYTLKGILALEPTVVQS